MHYFDFCNNMCPTEKSLLVHLRTSQLLLLVLLQTAACHSAVHAPRLPHQDGAHQGTCSSLEVLHVVLLGSRSSPPAHSFEACQLQGILRWPQRLCCSCCQARLCPGCRAGHIPQIVDSIAP
jgi:hypothetical protein